MSSSLKRPVVFMFVGMPGSGKTYVSRQLAKKLKIPHISGERVRAEIFDKPSFSPEEEGVVKHILLMMAEEFLRAELPVIIDTPLNRLADRREMRDFARKHKAVPLLVWQQIDPQSASARIKSRKPDKNPDDKYAAPFSKQQFDQACQKLEQPKHEDAVVISGKHSFNGQLQSILRSLTEQRLLADKSPLSKNLPSPGLVNLVAQRRGRVDMGRRNISVNH